MSWFYQENMNWRLVEKCFNKMREVNWDNSHHFHVGALKVGWWPGDINFPNLHMKCLVFAKLQFFQKHSPAPESSWLQEETEQLSASSWWSRTAANLFL